MLGLGVGSRGKGRGSLFILSLDCLTGAVQRHPRAALLTWAGPNSLARLAADLEASISHGLPVVCFMHLIAPCEPHCSCRTARSALWMAA